MHWSVSQAADVQLKILVLLWVGARTGKGTDLGANEGEVCNFSSCPDCGASTAGAADVPQEESGLGSTGLWERPLQSAEWMFWAPWCWEAS